MIVSCLQMVAQTVTVAWDPNPEPDISGYHLYYGEVSRAYSEIIDVGMANSVTTPTLLPGHTYYFSVTAYNIAGLESDYSTELQYTVPVVDNNVPPIASDTSVQISMNTQAIVTLGAVDPDGDSLTYTVVSNPAHGSLSGEPPLVTYTPAYNYSGQDSFLFKANDGKVDSQSATVSITVASVAVDPVVTWASPGGIVYGTSLGTAQCNAVANVPGSFSYSPAAGTVLDAGAAQTLSVQFTPDDLQKYNSVSASVRLDVLPAALSIQAPRVTKTYGDSMPVLEASYVGFVNGDTPKDLDVPVSINTAATASSSVGRYAVAASAAVDRNYTISFQDGLVDVVPAALAVRADNIERKTGEPNPPLTATYSGFVNGDDESDLVAPVVLATVATVDSPPGSYPITASGASGVNYSITHFDGQLDIFSSFELSVNFQPEGTPVPPGYVMDAGRRFGNRGNGFSFGWDFDYSGGSLDRDSLVAPDQRFDTLILLEKSGAGGMWEVEVPNGMYEVFVVAGDPEIFNAVYWLEVEGVTAIKGKPARDTRWVSGFLTVEVADGRLTLEKGNGARDNKVCFIDIKRVFATPSASRPVGETVAASVDLQKRIGMNAFDVTVSGEPGSTYSLETSENLTNWTVMSIIQLWDGDATVIDPDSFAQKVRFYRVVQ